MKKEDGSRCDSTATRPARGGPSPIDGESPFSLKKEEEKYRQIGDDTFPYVYQTH